MHPNNVDLPSNSQSICAVCMYRRSKITTRTIKIVNDIFGPGAGAKNTCMQVYKISHVLYSFAFSEVIALSLGTNNETLNIMTVASKLTAACS